MFKFLKDIIAPKKCYSCKKEGHFLCELCLLKMPNFESICYACKGKSNNCEVHIKCLTDVYYDKIIVLGHYKNNILSKMVKDLKFHGKKDIAEDFGYYLSNILINNEVYKNTSDYILIFPPMGFFKKLIRGYNQSQKMAQIISKIVGIRLENSLIKKVKTTRQQSSLNRQDRLLNLNNCFKLKKNIKNIEQKIFIIVDDVISTGSTINEISKLLKQSGAKKVIGLIVASD